ncbi:catenin delta-2 [Brachionus plicatilis]|uniref:Catenin delta-2 n=1 Tax=Brachionus plicatilis TaxID=10195 RepID=A0A3M7RVR4_BRAPC|nr:catenin delta-2 [Brachionus plicatilis]
MKKYKKQNGIVVGGWRNPTLPEVIDYLGHQSNEIRANAAAYLQHLCYQDDHIKAETRHLGGIAKLVNLLNSDCHEVHKNSCGALRNLSYGKTNDENKIEIKEKGGIPALVRLLKRSQDESVKETITAVLWNLSSCEEIKEQILYEGLSALVKHIIVPYAKLDILNSQNNRAIYSNPTKSNQRLLANDYSNYPIVLTNATGVLRNCSSNLQFSNCYEARKKLRDSEGLIESLLRIVDQAVEPYANESYYKKQQIVNLDLIVKDNMNSKCVENCMCILRNLSFRLQEIVDPNYDRDVKPFPGDEKTVKCVGTSSGKKRKNLEEEFLNTVYPYNMAVPNEGKAQELLWSLSTLNKYLIIIKESTVRDTIEAAVGCLQNLTACYWRPSVVIRQEIRRLKGLPTLVHLLKSDEYEDEPIVSVTAIALRNLAIDAKNRELIGKYAMKDLVAKLPDPHRPLPFRLSVLNEDTITASLACINECIKSNDDFVKSCYHEGGVKRMIYITRNGQHFPIKIVKYAAHVLASMWKHKNLHDLLKKDGYKETDFTNVAKQMGLKSQSTSPANTLHRPRGDVNMKPSMSGATSKKTKSKAKSQPKGSDDLNEMPIYSQVQRTHTNGSNKNLIVTNGSTNADSWV